MTIFKTENIRKMMENQSNIRNISIIAHVDHGKTTLADCLIGHGNRGLDTDQQEKDRGITIKSTAISLIYARNEPKDEIDYKLDDCKINTLEKNHSIPSKNIIKKNVINKYLINLIDSPGHVEFSAEVTGALRLTDGALVVVDCVEGPKCQTETVLRQAIQEKVKPVLFLNKMDRIFNNCKDINDLYDKYVGFRQIVERINSVIKIYETNNDEKEDISNELFVEKGMVGFGSGLQGFGFTIKDFAKMYYNENLMRKLMGKGAMVQIYSKKYNKWYKGKILKIMVENGEEWLDTSYKIENGDIIFKQIQRYSNEIKPLNNFIDKCASLDHLTKKLWGENYWIPSQQKWWKKKNNKDKKPKDALHGFTYFVLYPLKKLYDAFNNNDEKQYEMMIKGLNISLNKKDIDIAKKAGIMKPRDGYYALIMQRWLNAGKSIFNLIINHLPSPINAAKTRIKHLYTGNLLSKPGKSMVIADKNACLSAFISKTIYYRGSFISVCRIFSGTIKPNISVKIMNSQYIPGESNYIDNIKIQRIVMFNGNDILGINECYAGNICGITGLSDYLPKSGSISSFEPILYNNIKTLFPFKNMKYTVSNIVKIGINCKSKDLPKLNIALKKLEKIDPLIKIETNEIGQRLLSGSGELHLEVCLKELECNLLSNSVKLIKSDPIVSFCETITDDSKINIISKSANKLNRLKLSGNVINKNMLNIIDKNELDLPKWNDLHNMKQFGKKLFEKYKFKNGNKIWTFGCIENKNCQNNILVNLTKGSDYLNEIRDSVKQGFMQGTLGGVLCGENLRGVQINLLDSKVHSDPSHRKVGQITAMIQRGMKGVQMVSKPRLLEPIYEIEIEMPLKYQKNVLGYIYNKKGNLIDIKQIKGNNVLLTATLPAKESFGFVRNIKEKTSGQGFLNMNFSHWDTINVDPFDADIKDNESLKHIMQIRKRKGLKPILPNLSDYHDRINW